MRTRTREGSGYLVGDSTGGGGGNLRKGWTPGGECCHVIDPSTAEATRKTRREHSLKALAGVHMYRRRDRRRKGMMLELDVPARGKFYGARRLHWEMESQTGDRGQ